MLVGLCLQLCLLVLAFDIGGRALLRHQAAGELHFEIGQVRLRSLVGIFRIHSIVLQLRIAKLQNDRVPFHSSAGLEHDPIHVCRGLSGDPADIHWHEGSQAANFAKHFAAMNAVDGNAGTLHERRGRLEAGYTDGNRGQSDQRAHCAMLLTRTVLILCNGKRKGLAGASFLPRDKIGPGDVHRRPRS